jgi:hypothetical protein
MNALWALVGVAIGMGLGVLAQRSPGWVAQHPGTILVVGVFAVALAMLAVQVRMRRFERGHEARAEAFHLAMLEQFAPERLDTVS